MGPSLQGLQLVANKLVRPAALRRRDQYFERLLWVGCRPTPLMEAVIHGEYRINVGNLDDTSH